MHRQSATRHLEHTVWQFRFDLEKFTHPHDAGLGALQFLELLTEMLNRFGDHPGVVHQHVDRANREGTLTVQARAETVTHHIGEAPEQDRNAPDNAALQTRIQAHTVEFAHLEPHATHYPGDGPVAAHVLGGGQDLAEKTVKLRGLLTLAPPNFTEPRGHHQED